MISSNGVIKKSYLTKLSSSISSSLFLTIEFNWDFILELEAMETIVKNRKKIQDIRLTNIPSVCILYLDTVGMYVEK